MPNIHWRWQTEKDDLPLFVFHREPRSKPNQQILTTRSASPSAKVNRSLEPQVSIQNLGSRVPMEPAVLGSAEIVGDWLWKWGPFEEKKNDAGYQFSELCLFRGCCDWRRWRIGFRAEIFCNRFERNYLKSYSGFGYKIVRIGEAGAESGLATPRMNCW